MLESKSEEFALKAHRGQLYGTRDYGFHLEAVVAVAKEFNLSDNIVAACWLHDTMEDCKVSFTEIKKLCNEEVAELVFCVTDELGRNRKERKLKTYPKIAANKEALCVKLCDRIANLQQSILDNNLSLISMYLNEHMDFKHHLYNEDDHKTLPLLWNKLNTLVLDGETLLNEAVRQPEQ